jgi:hypothetical protein
MNGKDARIPVVYKANMSYSRFITNNLKLGATFYATLARNNYMYVDRNMVDEPFIRLSNEGNRGVYVPTVNDNGTNDWTKGRKSTNIGRVLELNSEGKVNQFAIVFDGTWRYFRDGEVSFSYTWNDAKDNTTYNGDVANTATLNLMVKDDPRDLSKMSYSDGQFRHKVVFYGTLPTFYGVSVGVRYSGIGGTRYSLAVNGNVNGDFVASNDLAYIFDVNDTKVAEKYRTAITNILNNPNASKSVKNYIEKSMGGIAERNGGINRFNGVWDVRIAKKFIVWKKQYIELSGDIFNVENLINKTWGASKNLGKQNIYTLNGCGVEVAAPDLEAAAARADVEQAPPVGRPRGLDVDLGAGGQPLDRAPLRAHDPDVEVAVGIHGERDASAVGAPRRLEVVGRARRERDGGAAVGGDGPHVAVHRRRGRGRRGATPGPRARW